MPDREKVIKHFEYLLNDAKGDYQDFMDLTVDDGEKILAMLKEQEAYGWRLCSEELPENDDEVLVTYIVNGNQKKRYVETASYFDHEEIDGHWNSVWDEYRVRGTKTEVIAWMPLPEPYKEGR